MQEKWFHLNWNILRHPDFYWLQELCESRGRSGQYPKYMWPVIPCDLTQQSGLRKKKQIEFQLPLGTSSTQILLALGKYMYLSRKIRQHFLGALHSASVHPRLTVCKIMLSPISTILPLILSKKNPCSWFIQVWWPFIQGLFQDFSRTFNNIQGVRFHRHDITFLPVTPKEQFL